MTRKFFGTDGIRGLTNAEPMTAETALRVGQAAGAHFLRGDHRHRVVIGKDTRLSRLHDGIGDGRRLHQRRHGRGAARADADPGGGDADAVDARRPRRHDQRFAQSLRRQWHQAVRSGRLQAQRRCRARDRDSGWRRGRSSPRRTRSAARGASTMPAGATSSSPRTPFPSIFGSTGSRSSSIAPTAPLTTSRPKRCGSWGPRSMPIGVAPDGININDGCGSTHPQLLQETVVASGADIGLALDGDADRLIVVDEKGELVDGDQLMALIALELNKRGELDGGAVVATVMSNLGLERKLEGAGLKLKRTQVGDRYVLEEMREERLQRRRRAIGSHHPVRPRHYRRRAGRGASGACGAGRGQGAGERGAAPVRAAAAAAQERPLQRRRGAARGRQRPQAHRRRRGRARRAAAGWSSASRAPSP